MSESNFTGIFGGSFDPVHLGHIELARAAVESGKVGEVFFIPANQAPMRDAPVRASDSDRLNMLEIALENAAFPHKIETCEIDRGGISYAIDTVNFLLKKYPERKFRWILGADHIAKLPQWYKIGEISRSIDFICAARPDYDIDVNRALPAKVELFKFAPIPHSSTKIRDDLARGEMPNMLDPQVLQYILKHKLYAK